jgi:N-acetylmuramoyl-L-alanine amidase
MIYEIHFCKTLFSSHEGILISGTLLMRIVLTFLTTGIFMLGVVGSMAQGALSPPVGITGFRHWSGTDQTRLVVDMQGETTYKAFYLQQPRRLVIDLFNTQMNIQKTTIPVGDQIVLRVRFGVSTSGVVRMVVDLKMQIQHEIFLLKPFQGRPHRLVVDLMSPELAQKEARERNRFLSRERRGAKVVVIDPGHGGEDPGAIGRRGTQEKNTVLLFARQLKEMLDRKRGFRVFLTRDGDYYVPLRKRYKIAQDLGAHLFISLHCDAHPTDRSARGASVYAISYKGATDETARILADRENASDQVAGILQSSNSLNTILLDMVQTHNLNESLRFGDMVLKHLRSVTSLKFSEPRQAGFMVLKAPEIPSLLVELGYISTREEERSFRNKRFRSRVCGAIAQAIEEFFPLHEIPSRPSSNLSSSSYQMSAALAANIRYVTCPLGLNEKGIALT